MIDRQISVGLSSITASLAWALAFILCGVAWLLGSIDVGRLSLLLCGVAVTLTVRAFLVEQTARIKSTLIASHDIGPAPVRSMR
jgi:hypothetical protein